VLAGGLLLQLALGFAIGLSLGLLGGGGSILTVPALVYLVGQAPHAAVTTALAIVAGNALLGAGIHRRQGTLNWRVALLFGGAGMGLAYLAAGLSRAFPPALLLVLFAGLMLLIGALMLGPRPPRPAAAPRWGVVLASGAGVGALTGLLGVGGGFLIVPALVMVVGLPMPQAVGTSLLVIAMNSLAGLAGHLAGPSALGSLDWALAGVFLAAGLAGSLLGARLAGRLPGPALRHAFGVLVIGLGLVLLVDNVGKLVS
jgi:uncharacterized membrane protein YfcA